MKLSEAILKGCEMVPVQAIGTFWVYSDTGNVTKACAVGAAALGVGGFPLRGKRDCLQNALVFLRDQCGLDGNLLGEIAQSNDTGTSREAIAAELAARGH